MTLDVILKFILDDVLPATCVLLSLHTVFLNIKDLRLIKNTQYKVVVGIATLASFLFAVVFGLVLAGVDRIFESSSTYSFGATLIRPITTVTLVSLNLMARGRHHGSREILTDDYTNTSG